MIDVFKTIAPTQQHKKAIDDRTSTRRRTNPNRAHGIPNRYKVDIINAVSN